MKDSKELALSFYETKSKYEDLSSEVSYIIRKALMKNAIEFANISFRSKSVKSFLGKIERKTYHDPLTEMTDLAGAKIVLSI